MGVHMTDRYPPLQADEFLREALAYMEPLRGSYVHAAITRDYMEKTGIKCAGYAAWLDRLLGYLVTKYGLLGRSVLDLGCGSGELTVQMNRLGYQAVGVDVHEKHLERAKVLARENGLNDDIFVMNRGQRLPFGDRMFDVVTLLSVLEHMDDQALSWILPELRRICRGVVFVLVPNKMRVIDDHTGMKLVPLMPQWLANIYTRIHNCEYRRYIANRGSWDVHYRWFGQIERTFKDYGFSMDTVPDDLIYPPITTCPPMKNIGKRLRLGHQAVYLRLPVERIVRRRGLPLHSLYPYLNLVFRPLSGN
jgi:2-polyprenyl-3-methyl-5-hydroxy-6-metoxy-1,4-benzoquinol methylase